MRKARVRLPGDEPGGASCKKAGVPRVCTYSLRGLWATLAVQSGAVSHAVAESLGHPFFAIPQKHYEQQEAVRNAALARVLDRQDKSPGPARLSAEELLRGLDAETLVKLTALLSVQKPKGKPAK